MLEYTVRLHPTDKDAAESKILWSPKPTGNYKEVIAGNNGTVMYIEFAIPFRHTRRKGVLFWKDYDIVTSEKPIWVHENDIKFVETKHFTAGGCNVDR